MQNHLAEVVVSIELVRSGDQYLTLAVIGGISLCRSDNLEPDSFGAVHPDALEGILIGVGWNTNEHDKRRLHQAVTLIEARLFQNDDGLERLKFSGRVGFNIDFGQHQKFSA